LRNLATAPSPYSLDHAHAFLRQPRDPILPSFVITERTDAAPRLVGACGLGRRPSGAVELGYWIARTQWSRGLATEACEAVIDIARTLNLATLEASYFIDNPASGRVLDKLGFEPTGIIAQRYSCARGEETPARLMRLALAAVRVEAEEPLAA